MRQSPGGRGGRSNWSRFQQHQHAPQAPYSLQPSPQSYQPQPPPNASQVQRDVVAFVEAFRANQSHPSAPPNALTLDVVVRAVCS
ncbi:hypothetical protein PR003_g34022, partial [Phytophthora rubi]